MMDDSFSFEAKARDDLFKTSNPKTHEERRGPEVYNKLNNENKDHDFDLKNILNNPEIMEMLKDKIKPPTPEIDYENVEAIKERVMKLINKSCDVNYEKEHEKVKELVYEAFSVKYQNLKMHYPDYDIVFPSDKSLNLIHKQYHEIIKTIYVEMNMGSTQLCYVLFLLVLEFVFVKALGVPMNGFAELELKRMYKYHSLMIELGESNYVGAGEGGSGGKAQSIEWRIATTFAWNVIIFLGINIISNYLGSGNMADYIRDIIEKIFETNINKADIENGKAKDVAGQGEELLSNLTSAGGFKDMINLVTKLGSGINKNADNRNRKKGPVKKSRFVFSE